MSVKGQEDRAKTKVSQLDDFSVRDAFVAAVATGASPLQQVYVYVNLTLVAPVVRSASPVQQSSLVVRRTHRENSRAA